MSKQEYVSIKVGKNGFEKIKKYYKNFLREPRADNICFAAKKGEIAIMVYFSKNSTNHTVLFAGPNPNKELSEIKTVLTNDDFTENAWICIDDQIGSDEVGTGDFFGPITVCGALIKASDIERLKELGVDDSKRLTDSQIRKLGPILIKEFKYSNLSLDNIKYNEIHTKKLNINAMKAKMHNRVLHNLLQKNPSIKNVFVDQFCNESTYYNYLLDTNSDEIVKNITFKTKGETWYPSVAVASIIARYSFLLSMDELSKKYNMQIPYGGGSNVTDFAQKFIKKYGIKELDKIVKKNFANYDEVAQIKLF